MKKENYNWKSNVFRFLLGQCISIIGSSLVQFAVIWYIVRVTESGVMVMISTLASFLPQIVISLFAGVWADRYNRKCLVIISDAGIALFTLGLAIVIKNGYSSVALIIVVSAIRSLGSGVQSPAINALISQLTPAEELMRANGIYSVISSIINFAVPALGGWLLSFVPISTIMFIDVITAVIGILITLTVSYQKQEDKSEDYGKLFTECRNGFQYIRKEHKFIPLFLGFMAYSILVVPAGYLNVLMVVRVFGDSYLNLSLNEIAFFVGATLGGILLSSLNNKIALGSKLLLAWFSFATLTIAMTVKQGFYSYLVLMVLVGLSVPYGSIPINVIIQEKIVSEMHGRVFSILQLESSVGMCIGMLAFGWLADVVSIQSIMIVCGIILIMISLSMLFTKALVFDGE